MKNIDVFITFYTRLMYGMMSLKWHLIRRKESSVLIRAPVIWSWCKPLSQWQCSFQMKAALPLAKKVCNDIRLLSLYRTLWAIEISSLKHQSSDNVLEINMKSVKKVAGSVWRGSLGVGRTIWCQIRFNKINKTVKCDQYHFWLPYVWVVFALV